MITTIIRRCVASNGSGGAAVAAHPRRCCSIPRVGRLGLATTASNTSARAATTGSLFSVKTTTGTATGNNNGGRTRQIPIAGGAAAAAVVARFPPPTPFQQQQRCKKSTVAASIEDDQDAQALAAAAAVATATTSTPYDNNTIVDDESLSTAFPSLIIRAGGGDGSSSNIEAVGSFAQSQAAYLNPDPDAVRALRDRLVETDTGIVAHYYMDVELQGILMAVKKLLPNRVGIADSLKMGDMAVDMVDEGGARRVICLGVDFMSESVQAILRQKGHADVPVYRADARAIGCSLAESAETDAYRAWLQQRAQKPQTPQQQSDAASACFLHVVYINTSLETKAVSNSLVPTIACTSSNVLQTLLQASAQVGPDRLRVLYGPDTYMGENLVALLRTLLSQKATATTTTSGEEEDGSSSFVWTDDKIRRDLHPQHTRESLQRLADNLHVYPAGNCVVHHMFGEAVVERVERDYIGLLPHTYVTAHLEVPGEMFRLAMEKSLLDEGVVGSTSDILRFIQSKVREHAAAAPAASAAAAAATTLPLRLRFILGTEAGMVTSIVQSVQDILNASPNPGAVEAEIIFPVAQEAVTVVNDNDDNDDSSIAQDNANHHHNLSIVPGVSGGEGCSTAGGCATCPFMKMNSLEALLDVLDMVAEAEDDRSTTTLQLERHLPPDRLGGKFLMHRPAVEVGSEPILYMREFMKGKRLPDQLVERIVATGKQ